MTGTMELTYYDAELEDEVTVEVPYEWVICPLCEGEGKHVNPSIDSHGLSAEDFFEDPDFAEDYFRGTYDVSCRQCGGRGSIKVAEDDDDPRVKAYHEQQAQAAQDAASDRWTQMMESGCYEPGWNDPRW